MKTIEVIDRVKSLFRERNIGQEDKLLSNRQVYNKLISSRARILSQALDSHKTLSTFCYQTLYVELTATTMVYDNTTPVLRSKNTIPNIITERNQLAIQSISNINNTLLLSPVNQEQTPYINYNKYTGKDLYYYFINNHLYIKNTMALGAVIITAIFYNPLAISGTVNYLEQDFPVDETVLDNIVALTLQELLLAGQKSEQPTQKEAETS